MKTLKRTLALLLVLVMALGTLTVAASAKTLADFDDADKVTAEYKAAVDAMIGLGIIEGDNTTLDPKGTLTRAAAAKIICFVLDGADAAEYENVPATTGFEDVDNDPRFAWAETYIALCRELGIVTGHSATVYAPGDAVTGAQFAKMLVCALGYDSVKEGFETSVWHIKAKNAALDLKIGASLVKGFANWNTALTREEAITMAWDAMKVTKQVAKYDANGNCTGYEAVTGDEATLAGSYGLDEVTGTIKYAKAAQDPVTKAVVPAYFYIQDGDNDSAQKLTVSAGYAQIGLKATVLTKPAATAQNPNAVAVVGGTFINATQIGEVIVTGFGKISADDLTFEKLAGSTFTAQGAVDESNIDDTLNRVDNGATKTAADKEDLFFNAGDTAVMYDTDGNGTVDTVTSLRPTLAKVGKVTDDGKKVSIVNTAVDNKDAFNVVYNVKAGDVALVYSILGTYHVEALNVQTGTLTGRTTANAKTTYTISGTAYAAGDMAVTTGWDSNDLLNKTVEYVVDPAGNLMYMAAPEATGSESLPQTVYGLLLAYQKQPYEKATTNVFGIGNPAKEAYEYAQILTADGIQNVALDVTVVNGVTKFVAGVDTNADADEYPDGLTNDEDATNDTYSIVKITTLDGKITAMTEVAKALSAATIDEDPIELTSDPLTYANSKTVYLYVTPGIAPNTKSFAAYTGYANAPATKNGSQVQIIDNKIVLVEGELASASSEDIYYVIAGAVENTVMGANNQPAVTYTYTAYKNGVKTSVVSKQLIADVTASGLYTLTTVDGVVTAAPAGTATAAKVSQSEATYFVAGSKYDLAPNAKFYEVVYNAAGTAIVDIVATDVLPASYAAIAALEADGLNVTTEIIVSGATGVTAVYYKTAVVKWNAQ